MNALLNQIHDHKQRELAQDQQRESVSRKPNGLSIEADITLQQVENAKELFMTDRERFFADYSDPASDESELVARAYDLGLTTADFDQYRERQLAAARGAF